MNFLEYLQVKSCVESFAKKYKSKPLGYVLSYFRTTILYGFGIAFSIAFLVLKNYLRKLVKHLHPIVTLQICSRNYLPSFCPMSRSFGFMEKCLSMDEIQDRNKFKSWSYIIYSIIPTYHYQLSSSQHLTCSSQILYLFQVKTGKNLRYIRITRKKMKLYLRNKTLLRKFFIN